MEHLDLQENRSLFFEEGKSALSENFFCDGLAGFIQRISFRADKVDDSDLLK